MAAQICETCKNKGKRCYCPPNGTCGGYEPRKITQFEKLKLMDIDELAEWLDKYGQFDGSLWMKWWDENYCQKCESVMYHSSENSIKFPYSWCEINGKCRFFQELDDVPNNEKIIKMWLQQEIKL